MAQKYRLKSSTVFAAQWDGQDTMPVADLLADGASLKPSRDKSLHVRRSGKDDVVVPRGGYVLLDAKSGELSTMDGSSFGKAYRKAR